VGSLVSGNAPGSEASQLSDAEPNRKAGNVQLKQAKMSSINAVPIPCPTIQDNSAFDTNSGPLSLRRKLGAPRALTSRDSTSIARGERMRPSTSNRQPLLGEPVGHGQTFELLPVGTAVEHKVVGPHLVRTRWRLRTQAHRSYTPPRSLARQLKSRRLPIRPAWAHPVSPPAKEDADAPTAIARILRRQNLHPRNHAGIPRSLRVASADVLRSPESRRSASAKYRSPAR
jgi:hypothetical protein